MTSSNELIRLVASYRFLQRELEEPSRAINRLHRNHIRKSLDETFLAIVRHRADDPAVSVKQIEFLLSVMVADASDDKLRAIVRDEVLAHVHVLAKMAGAPVRTAAPASETLGRSCDVAM